MERAAEIQVSEPKISANIDDATSQLESFYLPRDLSVFFVNDQDFRFLQWALRLSLIAAGSSVD